MQFDMRLVEKGKDVPIAPLTEQAKASAGLALKHQDPLKGRGWKAARTEALQTGIATLEMEASIQADERGKALLKTAAKQNAITEAKSVIRQVRRVLPIVLRQTKVEDVSLASFAAGEPLGRAASKISTFLTKIAEPVQRLDADFEPYFDGQSVAALLLAAKKALDSATVEQKVALADLPTDTLAVLEAKGRVLEHIEDLNRIAGNAFDGQAEMIGMFNKDILLRGRK